MKADPPGPRRINWTVWIMLALLAWGGYLAVGAVRAPGNLQTLRGLIIFGCTLAFLGLWWLALTLRARRLRMSDEEPE
jgi:hypothetical protein